MTRRELGGLVTSVVVCLAVAGAGGALTASSVSSWYPTLEKPPWNPPNAVFGPVWTTLYLMMAVSAWLVWRRVGFARARPALVLFAIQLALNLMWSALFFGLRRPDLALAEIVVLLAAIAATARAFLSQSRAAALLLVPYLLWVSYALTLNAAIWHLNR